MKSDATSVAAYVAKVPTERRAAIEKLRTLCKQNLSGYEEYIDYGMPCYKRSGVIEISFASQKQYIALYVHNLPLVKEFRNKLSASSMGKCCFRFTKPEKINFEAVRELVRKIVKRKPATS